MTTFSYEKGEWGQHMSFAEDHSVHCAGCGFKADLDSFEETRSACMTCGYVSNETDDNACCSQCHEDNWAEIGDTAPWFGLPAWAKVVGFDRATQTITLSLKKPIADNQTQGVKD